ncbi:hypothetical protein [Allobranchiibius sp. CTAmp26]|uniref:hypothetical protein n=1 Tax=Allobranchiibius sp. CTAmp26 TaxID=2815214 RepID=UPI001AA125D4|nr:hypothetical protein [Allobranchiibius sp. CTAmp26]MBO1756156.1 hypothetical protein [Allobranchiibius sp. CTAmp26]
MPQVDLRSVAGQFGPSFDPVLGAARSFWCTRTSGRAEGVDAPHILVELLTQDIRVSLRSLSVAGSLSVATGARIVAVVGSEPQWEARVWTGYDAATLRDLALAYGAVDVVDLRRVLPQVIHGRDRLDVDGAQVPLADAPALDRAHLAQILDATGARIRGVPRMTDTMRADEAHARLTDYSTAGTRIWEALIAHTAPIAFVTSHVDYAQWAPASIAAGRSGVPTVHVQSTGGLKAYWGIDPADREDGYRQELTRSLGAFFEDELWSRRESLRPAAELVAWRARRNLGAPSWWRSDGEDDEVAYLTAGERLAVRQWAADRLGLPAGRPVVVVFNHAVSDALGGNKEIFDSLADWFEQTADFAAAHPEVTWLLLDHPKQHLYDTTGFFEGVAERLGHHAHLRFAPSSTLTKNELWSLADLVVTVRGSVSSEFPAYGIPAVQAGWTEWSHCGFTMRADDRAQYWQVLADAAAALVRGDDLITDDQVERARLWMWFYRSGSDVSTGLVPHWEQGIGERLHRQLTIAMNCVEGDADALFTTVARWWSHPRPALLRASIDDVAASMRTVARRPDYRLLTSFDEPPESLADGERIETDSDPRLALLTGWRRSAGMVARAGKSNATLGVRLSPSGGSRTLTFTARIDATSEQWWSPEHPAEYGGSTRTLLLCVGGRPRGRFTLRPDTPADEAVVRLAPSDIGPSGLVVLDIAADPASVLPDPLLGVRIDLIQVDA